MGDLDELSRAIGRIEGTLDEMKKSQEAQWVKLEKVEKYILQHKLHIAGLAGGISIAGTLLMHKAKKLLGIE